MVRKGTTQRVRGTSCSAVAALLLIASCSGTDSATDDVESGTTKSSVASSPPSTTAFVSVDEEEEEEEEETIADLEAEWEVRRAQVADSLSVGVYGIDEDNVLVGPSGFEVDLDGCPRAWNDTAGIGPDTIDVVITGALSGQYQAFGDIALGIGAYFDYVNANGGIDGRRIALELVDDAYDATLSEEAVDEIIAAEDKPFAVTTIGSPGSLAVYDDLNDACIPQPLVVSPHPAWADPEGHPFTTGFQLSYTTEAILWGAWIKDNLSDVVPVRVGALVMDNDFGQIYADTFVAWAEANRDIVSEVIVVEHDPVALSVEPEMIELAESDPQVVLSMTAGEPCLSAVTGAAKARLTQTALALFTASGCREARTYLAPAGAAGHGFWVVGGGVKSLNDQAFAEETFVRFAIDQLTLAGLDPTRELIGVGFTQYGWAYTEMLRLASSLPGGLSRSNLLLALRGAELDHPMLLDGVRFEADGARDAYLIEGAEYSRYDAESETWFRQGRAVDVNGSSPTCSWVGLVCQR